MNQITQIAAPLPPAEFASPALPPAPSSISRPTAPSDADHDVIVNIAEVMRRLFLYLNTALQKISGEQESRIQTLNDVTAAQGALDNIKEHQSAPYDSSLFDATLSLGHESPAEGMSLWDILVYYGLKKEEDGRPKSEAELDALIGNVKTKTAAASSLATTTNQKMTMLNRTRESYVSLLSELVMGDVKLMRAIISMF